jgi:hypothetical protein
MPLNAPEGPSASQWSINVNSVLLIGEYPVPFRIEATPDNPDADGVLETIQKMIDLIDSSPDFTVNYAQRSYTYTQRVTPTA